MFIWKDSKLRANPYAPYIDAEGTRYPQVPRELLEEIPDPARGNDETEYTTEIDEAPYIVITSKSPEQLEQLRQSKVKTEIAALESGQARAVREAALGDKTHLQVIEDKIAALRATL